MNKLFFFLILFFAMFSFAQEMDTTYFINENGKTIGLIHAKGTTPVLPASSASAPAPVVQPAPAQVDLDYSAADSAAYYQDLANRVNQSGYSLHNAGVGMMIGGGVGTGIGLGLMVAGAIRADSRDDSYYDDDDDPDYDATFWVGYVLVLTMPEVFIAGIVLKSVGNHKIRRARQYEEKSQHYKSMMGETALSTLRFQPMFNPVNGAVGGNLAFNF